MTIIIGLKKESRRMSNQLPGLKPDDCPWRKFGKNSSSTCLKASRALATPDWIILQLGGERIGAARYSACLRTSRFVSVHKIERAFATLFALSWLVAARF